MKKKLLLIPFLFILMLPPTGALAQCAMCKAVAKSNMDSEQNKVGQGINKGVLYLLSVPYILAGIGGFVFWRNRRTAGEK